MAPIRRSTRLAAQPAVAALVQRATKTTKVSTKTAPKPPVKTAPKATMAGLNVGDSIPTGITLKDHNGSPVNLADVAKTSPFVVFLYPKASTPGCTRQALGFAAKYDQIAAAGYKVFGLSADSVSAQHNFCTKQSLDPVVLLSDPEAELVAALGSIKTPGTKSVLRSHYVVGKGGKIVDLVRPAKPEESVEKAFEYTTTHPVSGSKL